MSPLSLPTSIPAKPQFIGFDDDDIWDVPGYQRNLPHWRVDGVTYFVTFRAADSIPESTALRWRDATDRWLHAHGVDPAWNENEPARFQSAWSALPRTERAAFRREQARQFFVELDRCHGACILRRPAAQDIVAQALKHFHKQRLWTGDFVVMPNHVHILAQPFPGLKLEEWLYSVKRFSATQMLHDPDLVRQASLRAGHFWQTESFDRIVRDADELARTRAYIATNPSRLRHGEWLLWQAKWLDEFAPRSPRICTT